MSDATNERTSIGGYMLLRVALFCGLFVVVTFGAFSSPMPGAPAWLRDLANGTFEAGMVMGVVAPILAIIGAILTFRAQRRLSPLEWISLVMGLACALLPVMVVYAYSNCPNGVC